MSNSRALVTSSVLVISDDLTMRRAAREALLHETRHVFEAAIADAVAIARCIRLDTVLVIEDPERGAAAGLRDGLATCGLGQLRIVTVTSPDDAATALRGQTAGTTRRR